MSAPWRSAEVLRKHGPLLATRFGRGVSFDRTRTPFDTLKQTSDSSPIVWSFNLGHIRPVVTLHLLPLAFPKQRRGRVHLSESSMGRVVVVINLISSIVNRIFRSTSPASWSPRSSETLHTSLALLYPLHTPLSRLVFNPFRSLGRLRVALSRFSCVLTGRSPSGEHGAP